MKREDQPMPVPPLQTDSYSDKCSPGQTIGSTSPSGVRRQGVDAENAIAIDNGALRLPFMIQPGWGRCGIAYGPYKRTNGLTFAVFLLNGHNTSQTGCTNQLFVRRSLRWLAGSGGRPPVQQLVGLARSPYKGRILRRLQYWQENDPKRFQAEIFDENLAVGWFPHEVPSNPLTEGNGFVVHATGPENGELWTRVGDTMQSAFIGLQNLQIYYVVILRQTGAAYYAASVPNALGLVAYPEMRPLAIDPFNTDPTVYGGIYQGVQGQIGFSVDTRVYGTQITEIPAFATWYGSAHVADRLQAEGLLDGSEAEIGGIWQVECGNYALTAAGAIAKEPNSFARIDPKIPGGLLHTLITTSATVTPVGILWRIQDQHNCWGFWLSGNQCQLQIQHQGTWNTIAASNGTCLQPNTTYSVQILDDGKTFSLYLNGQLVFQTPFSDRRMQNATGVGFASAEGISPMQIHSFEVHPRSLAIPPEIDLGSPWTATGTQVVVADDFIGSNQDLAGKTSTIGNKIWRRDLGKGRIELTGMGSAKVQASIQNPNPGRTIYTVDWDYRELADIQVEITPPKRYKDQKTEGRGGLIFWQDQQNYMIVANWLSASYGGASVSSFFCVNGFEDVYDAVWTNIGQRISWGVPHVFNVVFDGINYLTSIDGEPVLYRALTDVYPQIQPLSIHRIGVVANWEWGGDDMGTIFKNFQARI